MKINMICRLTNVLLIAVLAGFATVSIQAQKKTDNAKDMADAQKDAREAAQVLSDMMKKPDDFIPRELLDKAEAIAVFPDVVKGAFIVGGRGGHGVVSRKTANGWSVPVFFNIGGASFGPQIGVKRTDYVMLFMNDAAFKDLMDEKLEFGGDLSFAAGPVGRTTGAGTTASLDTGVLTWSRSAGAFVGASLKGAELNADNSKNEAVYGMSAKDILANPDSVKTSGLSGDITNFSRTVAGYAAK